MGKENQTSSYAALQNLQRSTSPCYATPAIILNARCIAAIEANRERCLS